MKRFCLLAALLSVLSACTRGGAPVLENDLLSIGFNAENGAVCSIVDKTLGVELLDSAQTALPWSFEYRSGVEPLSNLPSEFSYKRCGRKLILTWAQPKGAEGPEVTASVFLGKKDMKSSWRIRVDGIRGCGIRSIDFPVIAGIRPQGDDELAYPGWTGQLVRDPYSVAASLGRESIDFNLRGPGELSLQAEAIYKKGQAGLYVGSDDTEGLQKEYHNVYTSTSGSWYIEQLLVLDDSDRYESPYNGFVGTFQGDWMTVSAIYRKWAVQQKWCRDACLKRGTVPDWVLKIGVWEWNRGRSENVLPEAVDLQERLGLPVSVLWHWWHNCPYDDGFPEYIPPREGRESFIKAVAAAQEKGIHCLPYMNSRQWGSSSTSWVTEGAEKNRSLKEDGTDYAHVYNFFTGHALVPMCHYSHFWRDRYVALCDTVVNAYGANGVYLDQAGISYPCYDPAHGHPLGGGNYSLKYYGEMVRSIREATKDAPTEPAFPGEGCSEDWLPHLDMFLTLHASIERTRKQQYKDWIPFFHSVYHDYAVYFLNFSTLVYPPYDEKWPDEYRTELHETPLPDIYDQQFRIEQARTVVWGIQPAIANYHPFLWERKAVCMNFFAQLVKMRYNALPYLLYGEFQRPPEIDEVRKVLPVCKATTYAMPGTPRLVHSEREVPTVLSGCFKAPDGSVGVVVSNTNEEAQLISFDFDPARYGLPRRGVVKLITDAPQPAVLQDYDASVSLRINHQLPACSTCVLVFEP